MEKTYLMTKSTKGFYTVEAAIFLPIFILSVLAIGYFLKADAAWEDHMSDTYNKCSYYQALAGARTSYSNSIHVVNPKIQIRPALLPIITRDINYNAKIKYRDFIGFKYEKDGMGAEGLENEVASNPVWIFPQSGIKYHKKSCSYVQACVHSYILTNSLKRKYSACEICDSASVSLGEIVFCFAGENTCYHRGACRCINRHVITIDKYEAEKDGYMPCSKCGG